MGISLVIMKGGPKGTEGGLMDEEIFGPVLPIIPVDVSTYHPKIRDLHADL